MKQKEKLEEKGRWWVGTILAVLNLKMTFWTDSEGVWVLTKREYFDKCDTCALKVFRD
jgi:hypothetical protein